jgi:short-subunit dehydrogenase
VTLEMWLRVQHGYFDALRAEVSIHNISVSLVCPGPVESEISEHTIRSKSTPKV